MRVPCSGRNRGNTTCYLSALCRSGRIRSKRAWMIIFTLVSRRRAVGEALPAEAVGAIKVEGCTGYAWSATAAAAGLLAGGHSKAQEAAADVPTATVDAALPPRRNSSIFRLCDCRINNQRNRSKDASVHGCRCSGALYPGFLIHALMLIRPPLRS